MRRREVALRVLAPVLAVVLAIGISSLILVLIGESPVAAFSSMLRYSSRFDSVISILNRAVPLYLSGLAVGIGFKMGLFNIGVEGQFRLAALVSAYVGGVVTGLPPVLHVLLIVLVAMAVGGVWAGIAGVLKVTRGVHEVISTIMLNFIATGLGAYLLANYLREPAQPGDLQIKTAELAPSGRFPSLNPLIEAVGLTVPRGANLQGFIIVAALVGLAYYVLIWRTRYGYDLRASGANPSAAEASGVDPRRMIVLTMLCSGALAGLVGMSQLLGFFHRYTIDFPVGLGFAGIAVALLGRNHPVGVAVGALLFGFLDRSAQILDLEGIPKEIITIIQGVIILTVVIAYEIAARFQERLAAEATRAALEHRDTEAEEVAS